MTAPTTAPMTGPLDRFEIRTDRAAVYRRVKRGLQWGFVGVILTAGLVCGVVTAAADATASGTPLMLAVGFGIGALTVMFTVSWMITGPVMWVVRREMPVPLVADGQGVWMAVPGTAEGFVRLPWWAVSSVTTRGNGKGKGVVVKIRRDVHQTAPGVEGLTDSITISAARRGIVVSTVGTNVTARQAHAVLDQYARAAHGGGPR